MTFFLDSCTGAARRDGLRPWKKMQAGRKVPGHTAQDTVERGNLRQKNNNMAGKAGRALGMEESGTERSRTSGRQIHGGTGSSGSSSLLSTLGWAMINNQGFLPLSPGGPRERRSMETSKKRAGRASSRCNALRNPWPRIRSVLVCVGTHTHTYTHIHTHSSTHGSGCYVHCAAWQQSVPPSAVS